MSIESDFRAAMVAYAPLVALVGTRVALNAVPDGSAFPLVVYTALHDRTVGLDNSLLADRCTLSVQCWADTAAAAAATADAVIAAVALAPASACAVVLDRAGTFDPETSLDGETLTVEWWA